jgi:hypothetical protein
LKASLQLSNISSGTLHVCMLDNLKMANNSQPLLKIVMPTMVIQCINAAISTAAMPLHGPSVSNAIMDIRILEHKLRIGSICILQPGKFKTRFSNVMQGDFAYRQGSLKCLHLFHRAACYIVSKESTGGKIAISLEFATLQACKDQAQADGGGGLCCSTSLCNLQSALKSAASPTQVPRWLVLPFLMILAMVHN